VPIWLKQGKNGDTLIGFSPLMKGFFHFRFQTSVPIFLYKIG